MPSGPKPEKDPVAIARMARCEIPVPWCEQFERMISGMNFKAGESLTMLNHKLNTKRSLKKFNDDSIPDDATWDSLKLRRMSVAKGMLGKLGRNTNIEAPFFCTWGTQIFIGDDVYINCDVKMYDSAAVTIGNRTLIGPGVYFCTDTHSVESGERRATGGSFAKPIDVGDDCWIGMNANILPGITIGYGSAIAAGAVVCKDVPKLCLYGGVPAKLIRKLKCPEDGRRILNGCGQATVSLAVCNGDGYTMIAVESGDDSCQP